MISAQDSIICDELVNLVQEYSLLLNLRVLQPPSIRQTQIFNTGNLFRCEFLGTTQINKLITMIEAELSEHSYGNSRHRRISA